MSMAYALEQSWISIRILCVDAGHLRQRLPHAWDQGQSNIKPDALPADCSVAKNGLEFLRQELFLETSTYMARTFGAARASVQGRHGTTLTKFAEMMLNIHADLERHEEMKRQEAIK